MKIRKASRLLALTIAFVFMFSTFAAAAIPPNTLVLKDKAFDMSLLNNEDYMLELQEAAFKSDNQWIYIDNVGQYFNAINMEPADSSAVQGTIEYIDDEGNKTIIEAEKPEDELEVVEVSAITDTVDGGVGASDQYLEFTINNGKKVTIKQLENAGYDIEFKTTVSGLVDETGKITGRLPGLGKTFEYIVEISKDGELVCDSGLKEVKVLDYANTVTEIEKINILDSDNVALDAYKLTTGGGKKYNLEIIGKTMADEEEDEAVALEDLDKKFNFKSSLLAAVTVDNKGNLTTGSKGNAVITIETKDKSIKKTVNVSVVDKPAISAEKSVLDTTPLVLATGQEAKVTLTLRDENGNLVSGASIEKDDPKEVLTTNSVGFSAKEDIEKKGQYELTLTAADEAGEGLVTIKVGEVELGKIKVTVKAPKDEVAYYVLKLADKQVLDLKGAEDGKVTVKFVLEAYDDEDIKTGAPQFGDDDDGKFALFLDGKMVSTDGKIEFDKTGTYNVVAKVKAGDIYKDIDASLEVVIVDTTPEITEVIFDYKDGKVEEAKTIALEDILTVKAEYDNKAVKVKFDVDDECNVKILEDAEEGISVQIGTVKVVGIDGVKFQKDGEKAVIKLQDNAAVEGIIQISVEDMDGNIIEPVLTIEVDIPKADGGYDHETGNGGENGEGSNGNS